MSSTAPECEPEPKKRCVDRAGAAGVENHGNNLGAPALYLKLGNGEESVVLDASARLYLKLGNGDQYVAAFDDRGVARLASVDSLMLENLVKFEDERDERRAHQDASETKDSDDALDLAFATVNVAIAGLRDDLAVRVGEDDALGVALMMVNTAIEEWRKKVAVATWHFGDDGNVVENGAREGSTR